MKKIKNKGFTLIEIVLVMGMIAILSTIVLVAINPSRQFAEARDTERTAHLNTILNAIGQRMADHKGVFEEGCSAGAIPLNTAISIKSTSGYNIFPCLVPTYITVLPVDPKKGFFTNDLNYDTAYNLFLDSSSGRITISAPFTEMSSTTISVSR